MGLIKESIYLSKSQDSYVNIYINAIAINGRDVIYIFFNG